MSSLCSNAFSQQVHVGDSARLPPCAPNDKDLSDVSCLPGRNMSPQGCSGAGSPIDPRTADYQARTLRRSACYCAPHERIPDTVCITQEPATFEPGVRW